MKNYLVAVLLVGIAGVGVMAVQEPAEMPKPEKEHAWLKQLAGEWDAESEVTMGPGAPPMKLKGTESGRMLGDKWLVSEIKGDSPMGIPMSAVLTVGYDPEKKKFVGTWIDSFMPFMWRYEGTLDEAGKKLTLNTEGPNMMVPGKTAQYRETIEIVDKDHKTFSSSMKGDDGNWTTFVTGKYTRKK